jgi:hypothetical protein
MTNFFAPQTRLRLAWFCFGVHVVALVAMLLVLINGLLLGDVQSRRAFVATHALAWSIGWLIWMPASLALVMFFMAMADALPYKGWGLLATGIALVGAVMDWSSETVWIFLSPTWAIQSASDPFYAHLYAVWDLAYNALSMGMANLLYTVGGIILVAITMRTKNFPRGLFWLGTLVWSLSLAFSYAGFMGDGLGIFVVSSGLFPLFMAWVLLVGYRWLRRDVSRVGT